MKLLHLADLHYGVNPEQLEETDRCSNFALDVAERERPDVIVFAGDSCDEYLGKIRIDSDCARRMIALMQRAASIAPVLIITGTPSHDRETPYLFRHLSARFPIHVSSEIETVALTQCSPGVFRFDKYQGATIKEDVAVFTCIPSIDKRHLMASYGGSIQEGNMETRGLIHDLFAGLGLVNDTVPDGIPCVAVLHGMCTGSQYSQGGQVAVGEDLEFGVADLAALHADYCALGHVHMQQSFDLGNGVKACYSGSPGRNNFGEKEAKGFLLVDFTEIGSVSSIRNVPTPARKFCFVEAKWSAEVVGIEHVEQAMVAALPDAAGADVRFRFDCPEEMRALVDRAGIEKAFLDAGALRVKCEMQILPRIRQRAAGISQLATLPAKVQKWGDSTDTVIPESVLALAGVIEGLTVEELLQRALNPLPASEAHVVSGQVDLSLADGEEFAPGSLEEMVDNFNADRAPAVTVEDQINLF